MFYEHVLSIGHRCTSQLAIQFLHSKINKYGETTPFSWVNNFNALNILRTIQTNFENYLQNTITGDYHKNTGLPTLEKHGFGHYNINDK